MRTTIAIPTRTAALLEGCLGALKLTTPGVDEGEVAIVVVANGTDSERKEIDALVRQFRGVLPPTARIAQVNHLPDEGPPAFYGNWCHAGAEHALQSNPTGEYRPGEAPPAFVAEPPQELVFLNDDTHPGTGWIESFRNDMANAKRMGIRVGLLGARGPNVSGPQNIFDPTEIAARQRIYAGNPEKILVPVPVAFLYPRIVTFAAFCEAEAYRESGGFDQALPAHNFSDDILSLRMLKANRHNFVSGSFVDHLGSATLARGGTVEGRLARYEADMKKGEEYFLKTYPEAGEVFHREFASSGIG